jgi:hypothetical protein
MHIDLLFVKLRAAAVRAMLNSNSSTRHRRCVMQLSQFMFSIVINCGRIWDWSPTLQHFSGSNFYAYSTVVTDSHAFQLRFYANSTAQPGSNHSCLRIYEMSIYSMFIYHNFRYHHAKAEINNLAGAILVGYTKGNAVGAYQYRPHLSIRSPSFWQITVVERYNTDGIKYPVPLITIFQSLLLLPGTWDVGKTCWNTNHWAVIKIFAIAGQRG